MPDLSKLDRRFRPIAEHFVAWVRERDAAYRVTSARRTWAEQARLYAEYQAGRNNGLPAEPPGRSLHQRGLAFDLARPGVPPFEDAGLRELGAIWRRYGGSWSERDPVHFAYTPAMAYLSSHQAPRRRRRRARIA